ncbi:MAG: alpha/beta fold hydrolase [Acidobacteriota bacterium]
MTPARRQARPAATSGVIAGPRGPIGYQLAGHGPALALLAGLGSTTRLWGELVGLLARHCTVVAMDNRGVGGSSGGEPFTLSGAADDLAHLARQLGLATLSVLGVSMGGLVAVRAAARHPTLVRHLVAVSCGLRSTPSHSRVLRFFELALTRLSPAEAAEALMAFAFSSAFADAYPGFVDQAARLWAPEPADLPGALGQLAHLQAGFDLGEDARTVTCPALVIAGALDPIVPAAASRELASAIPGAMYRELPAAAHSVLAEGGPQLFEEILAFLDLGR